MKVAEKSKFYKIKLLWHRIRHGLFLFTLRNALTRIGLDIEPYYWYKEIKNGAEKPKKELEQNLSMGQICIGLKRGKEIAALLFVDLQDFVFKGRSFKIKDKEGYLLNVYTFQAYRGKNLATYLRYHCFELLENYSVEELYSIVSYFNTSSIKVNEKLNAQKLKLYLYIGLLKRYHWNFLLRDYSK